MDKKKSDDEMVELLLQGDLPDAKVSSAGYGGACHKSLNNMPSQKPELDDGFVEKLE